MPASTEDAQIVRMGLIPLAVFLFALYRFMYMRHGAPATAAAAGDDDDHGEESSSSGNIVD